MNWTCRSMCCASGKAASRRSSPVKRAGGRRYYRPEDIDLLKGIRALLYSDGFTIKGVQKVLKDRGLRHVAGIGRGDASGLSAREPAPMVIEKIVYVEKPAAAPARKPQSTHLRAVPDPVSLPFFDQTPDVIAPKAMMAELVEAFCETAKPETVDVTEGAQERVRLEALLGELLGLKARLLAARRG